jgi:processing peptidase subunit beta
VHLQTSIGETATVGVFVDAGSRNEKASGAAQLVQQLMVKAAKGKIEAMGAQLSSYTTREKTVYSVKALKGDVGKAVEILGSALSGGLPDDATVAAEKAALVSSGLSASYEDVILDELHTTAFMGTSLGGSILDSENVSNLSKADLSAFLSANYTADRLVIAGAGAVDHKQLCDVAKSFGAASSGLALHYEPASFTGSDKRIRYDSMGVSTPDTRAVTYDTIPDTLYIIHYWQ